MKKFISILFLSVLVSQGFIMASERTDFVKNLNKYGRYFYSAKNDQVIEFETSGSDEIIKRVYTVSLKDKSLNLEEEKSLDVINVPFNEFDAVRKSFSIFNKISERRNPEAYYDSKREYVINFTYTEGKIIYYYVPGKNLTEVYKYIEKFKKSGIKNQKVTLEAVSEFDWDYRDSVQYIYIDEYGYKNVQVIDGDSFLLIDGPEPSSITFKRDKNGKLAESYFLERPSLIGSTLKFTASSTLKDKNHTYSADNLNTTFDRSEFPRQMLKNPVPWVEGVKGPGIGETIEFDNIPSRYGFYIVILNGYVDPLKPYLFRENNRIKKLKVETDTGYSEVIEFNDQVEFKMVKYPYEAAKVKLTILEVYKGTKYDDTCITSMYLLNTAWAK
jgi:hypothetical protein